ncbi:5445_t:CDS:2, partial [Funneliformis geosporum]
TIQEEHKEAYNKNKPLNKDESCVLYNPVKQKVNKTFKNFWNYHENAHNSEKTSKAAIALLYYLLTSIKPLTPIPKSTTKAMDKDQLKVFIDSIIKGLQNFTKELKSSSSGRTFTQSENVDNGITMAKQVKSDQYYET